jgi:hypothetical protein
MSADKDAEIDHAEHAAAIAEFNEKAALRYIATLEARVAKLEAALEDIGKQMLMSEMGAEQAEYADYEGAYETMVKVARAAMKFLEEPHQ